MANEQNNFENHDVSRLLGSMKSIEAPADFDFRVRARIAAGRPRAAWRPIAGRIAVAAVLALLVAGYFGFRGYQAPVTHEASVVPMPVVQPAAPSQPQVPRPSESFPAANDPTEVAVKTPTERKRAENIPVRARHRVSSETTGGGSVDMASGISTPLTAIGAQTNHSGSVWTVGEVKQNSVADRSGLKAGDVIESVKNKTVRVRRDGKVVQIELKP